MLQWNGRLDVGNHDSQDFTFDHSLWDFPEKWPHDPPDFVFLARAFNDIGRSCYKGKWKDSDWNGPAAERRWEEEWDEEHEPELTDEDRKWLDYKRFSARAKVAFRGHRATVDEMRAVVAQSLARQCELGVLVTAIRPVEGGPIQRLEPHYWNTELIASRFFRCDMSLVRPFEPVRNAVARSNQLRDRYWIYVTRESLDRFVSGKAQPEKSSAAEVRRAEDTSPVADKQIVTKRCAGRTPGSGSFDVADKPLLEEMRDLITKGLAKSPNDAARQLAERAQGKSTLESRQTRLAKRFQKYQLGAK
jgi:hypothetical protein